VRSIQQAPDAVATLVETLEPTNPRHQSSNALGLLGTETFMLVSDAIGIGRTHPRTEVIVCLVAVVRST
jgi:hypothetical protein